MDHFSLGCKQFKIITFEAFWKSSRIIFISPEVHYFKIAYQMPKQRHFIRHLKFFTFSPMCLVMAVKDSFFCNYTNLFAPQKKSSVFFRGCLFPAYNLKQHQWMAMGQWQEKQKKTVALVACFFLFYIPNNI